MVEIIEREGAFLIVVDTKGRRGDARVEAETLRAKDETREGGKDGE